MSNFFEGMKIGVDKYGIKDFQHVALDGVTYLKHGDSNLKGAPVIHGFSFTIQTTHKYEGTITLLPSPYVEYETKAVQYTIRANVDYPITKQTIADAGLEWLDSRNLPVTPEERAAATEWLTKQTKFSLLAWYEHFNAPESGADLIKARLARELYAEPNRTIQVTGTTEDGQVRNFEAKLDISKDNGPVETIAIHEVVLDNGTYYLFA